MSEEDTTNIERKLKSSEPDLEVVVGAEQNVLWHYSVILVSYSDYIETMLSAGMKGK